MAAILIIEPDLRTACRMRDALTANNHICMTTTSAAEGAQMVQHGMRMLVILNARLPWVESITLLQTLAEKEWPVLFTTTDATNSAHLQALYQGSCDVLPAPIDALSLRAAVNGLLHRTSRQLSIGALHLDADRREATLDGQQLTLTAQEFALLHALMQSPDTALSRQELLRTAWGYQGIGETRTVDVHIQRLRRKLGASCIETVYKLGYRLRMA